MTNVDLLQLIRNVPVTPDTDATGSTTTTRKNLGVPANERGLGTSQEQQPRAGNVIFPQEGATFNWSKPSNADVRRSKENVLKEHPSSETMNSSLIRTNMDASGELPGGRKPCIFVADCPEQETAGDPMKDFYREPSTELCRNGGIYIEVSFHFVISLHNGTGLA